MIVLNVLFLVCRTVGDTGVGKSALTLRWIHSEFIDDYDPTLEDSYRKQVGDGQDMYIVEVVDSVYNYDYSTLGYICHGVVRSGDGFLALYSTTSMESYERLCDLIEVIYRVKDTRDLSMVVIGTKSDLTHDRQVSSRHGQDLANLHNAPFRETSALQDINISDVFSLLIAATRSRQQETELTPATSRNKNFGQRCTLM